MKFNRLLFAGCFILTLIIAAAFGLSLPRIARVSGYVSTTIPPVKVHITQPATVISIHVRNGAMLDAKALILIASTERPQGLNSVETRQRNILRSRRSQFDFEAAQTSATATAQASALVLRVKLIQSELTASENEMVLLKTRAELAQNQIGRYGDLHAQGFVSAEGLSAKQADAADVLSKVYALERTRSVLARELAVVQLEMHTNVQRTASQLSQFKREKMALEQELNESEAKRLEVIAPIRGRLTQLQAQLGQVIRPEIPLAVVLPEDSRYELVLLVPSRSVGFVRVDQEVSVRYLPYPHEHYGRHKGKVVEISQSALLPNEIPNHIAASNEPLFTVKVSLPSEDLVKNGTQLRLSPGMLAEADIQLDRLKIYQWLLQPLFRLGGRL